jgi:hypothetical protein
LIAKKVDSGEVNAEPKSISKRMIVAEKAANDGARRGCYHVKMTIAPWHCWPPISWRPAIIARAGSKRKVQVPYRSYCEGLPVPLEEVGFGESKGNCFYEVMKDLLYGDPDPQPAVRVFSMKVESLNRNLMRHI